MKKKESKIDRQNTKSLFQSVEESKKHIIQTRCQIQNRLKRSQFLPKMLHSRIQRINQNKLSSSILILKSLVILIMMKLVKLVCTWVVKMKGKKEKRGRMQRTKIKRKKKKKRQRRRSLNSQNQILQTKNLRDGKSLMMKDFLFPLEFTCIFRNQ